MDDILVASRSEQHIKVFKEELSKEFEVKDLGKAKYFLGLEIHQDKNRIDLMQAGYVLGLLKQYGMDKCNLTAMPSEIRRLLKYMELGSELGSEYPYRELIGSFMYLSVATRPDISNTMSWLAQFLNKPYKCHWIAAKRILRYLAGTARTG